ncbi:MAG: hypothetical protein IJ659_05205 [Alloprevotella sp.]|nr:hypothetical protein [Alloprevotella sp.]
MKIFEFNKYFPNEAACRRKFKEMRDKEGVACQRKYKVMVIAESLPVDKEPKKGQKPKSVKHIKMIVIPDEKAKTIDAVAAKSIDKDSRFERLLMITASYRTDFGHKVYNKNVA